MLYLLLFALAMLGYLNQGWWWVPAGAALVFLVLVKAQRSAGIVDLSGNHAALREVVFRGTALHALVGSTAAYGLGLLVRFTYPI